MNANTNSFATRKLAEILALVASMGYVETEGTANTKQFRNSAGRVAVVVTDTLSVSAWSATGGMMTTTVSQPMSEISAIL